ncbi:MAG: holo-[acyl-carrier protein] synthase [Janthinobacterium sp.]|jgi:holo-[acyl-carrier protein] synthase
MSSQRVYGIGTDICKIARIAQALARHGERFAEKILGPQELQTFHARGERNGQRAVRFLATRFAAKEAFSKAIGLGLHMPMTWRAAQVQNAPSGKPIIVCSGVLAQFMTDHKLSAQVTLSDEDDYAVAFVIAEQAD